MKMIMARLKGGAIIMYEHSQESGHGRYSIDGRLLTKRQIAILKQRHKLQPNGDYLDFSGNDLPQSWSLHGDKR